jgi:hypothetical protein
MIYVKGPEKKHTKTRHTKPAQSEKANFKESSKSITLEGIGYKSESEN